MSPLLAPLSPREREVFLLRLDGRSMREIATQLYVTLTTVKVHERNIRMKLEGEYEGWGWWVRAARAYERGCAPECLRQRACQCERRVGA